jgi:predicted transcriptional regulator
MALTDAMLAELQRMNRLLALVAVKGHSAQEATIMLNNAGYGMTEIAKLLDRKPSAVSMTLTRYRESKKEKAPKTGSEKLVTAEATNDGPEE